MSESQVYKKLLQVIYSYVNNSEYWQTSDQSMNYPEDSVSAKSFTLLKGKQEFHWNNVSLFTEVHIKC